MTNAQMIVGLAATIVLAIEILKSLGLKTGNAGLVRIISIALGAVLGFLWWVCSNYAPVLLQMVGAVPVNEAVYILVMKGVFAGLGGTFGFKVIVELLKKRV